MPKSTKSPLNKPAIAKPQSRPEGVSKKAFARGDERKAKPNYVGRRSTNGARIRQSGVLAAKGHARTGEDGAELTDGKVRLNKHLADCGIASRRHADQMIADGQVMINGKKVYELGVRVDPVADRILVNGKPVRTVTEKVYLMFNKPKNVVTTMNDPDGRPSIADFVERMPMRVFPVGRLDWDSEGLILLTNDGDFAQKVTHPSEEIPKTYLVKVNGKPGPEHIQKLLTGVPIIGGRVHAKSVERVSRGADLYDWMKVIITEGKNRQIRLMFEKIGFDVMKLQRVAIGKLKLGKLERGEFKILDEEHIAKIFEKYEPTSRVTHAKETRAKQKRSNQVSKKKNIKVSKTLMYKQENEARKKASDD